MLWEESLGHSNLTILSKTILFDLQSFDRLFPQAGLCLIVNPCQTVRCYWSYIDDVLLWSSFPWTFLDGHTGQEWFSGLSRMSLSFVNRLLYWNDT